MRSVERTKKQQETHTMHGMGWALEVGYSTRFSTAGHTQTQLQFVFVRDRVAPKIIHIACAALHADPSMAVVGGIGGAQYTENKPTITTQHTLTRTGHATRQRWWQQQTPIN